MQEVKMSGESLNIEQENISKLKEIFPEVFNEDKIDFDKLQNVLGNYIDTDEEKYRFTWNGKMNALRLSQTPSLGTLRPCKGESRDWDTTQNLYIEGDNLEVLKLLQNSYLNKIKMIYIDPPYNTGNDFVYKDDFKDNIENYKKVTGQIDSEGNATSTNKDSDGRYHTNWLNMMYPRLRLARNLLSNEGVIFISIGEEELDNLIKLGSFVFGDSNRLGVISRVSKTASNKGTYFAPSIDYIVVFAKNASAVPAFIGEVDESLYKKVETEGERIGEKYRDDVALYQSALDPMRGCRNQRYFIQAPDGSLLIPPGNVFPQEHKDGSFIPPSGPNDKVWRWSYSSYFENKHLLVFKETQTSPLLDENGNKAKYNVYTKSYLSDRKDSGTLPRNLWEDFINRKGADLLKKMEIPFDFSKPVELIQYMLKISDIKDGDIVLDFFSGSATTAHACMKYNFENNGKRKFIMVQLPETTYEEVNGQKIPKKGCEEAFRLGYESICKIGQARIKKAGDMILSNVEQSNLQLKIGNDLKKAPDIGFKVFKLDSSNMRKWNPDTKNLEQSLLDQINNFVDGRTEEDALYEIILKNGLPLTVPVEELDVRGKKVYSIGMGALIVCLDNNITLDIADEIANISTEFEDKSQVTVVFKDNGFANDSVKTNIKETIRGYGIGKFVTV